MRVWASRTRSDTGVGKAGTATLITGPAEAGGEFVPAGGAGGVAEFGPAATGPAGLEATPAVPGEDATVVADRLVDASAAGAGFDAGAETVGGVLDARSPDDWLTDWLDPLQPSSRPAASDRYKDGFMADEGWEGIPRMEDGREDSRLPEIQRKSTDSTGEPPVFALACTLDDQYGRMDGAAPGLFIDHLKHLSSIS